MGWRRKSSGKNRSELLHALGGVGEGHVHLQVAIEHHRHHSPLVTKLDRDAAVGAESIGVEEAPRSAHAEATVEKNGDEGGHGFLSCWVEYIRRRRKSRNKFQLASHNLVEDIVVLAVFHYTERDMVLVMLLVEFVSMVPGTLPRQMPVVFIAAIPRLVMLAEEVAIIKLLGDVGNGHLQGIFSVGGHHSKLSLMMS